MKQYNFPEDRRLVPETNVAQAHAVLLRMLKIMGMISEAHDIDFWLEYGTLLGAVRHQGFIPWDHEADIGMLRTDFEKLQDVAAELPEDIFLQTAQSDPYYEKSAVYIEAKLRDKYSNYIEFEKACPTAQWHNGIQVDIFVYDFDRQAGGTFTNAFERIFSESKYYLTGEELEHTVATKFEDWSFQIPVGYDAYLKRNYGNYMELPPLIDRQVPYIDIISPCRHANVLHWK